MPRETRRWTSFVWFIFIAAVLPVTLLLILKLPENFRPFIGGLKYLDPTQLHGGWSSSTGNRAVSPNLTACRSSWGCRNFLVDCCPPVDELNETIVDFQFPDPSSPWRVRRPAHLLDADYIAKYSEAVFKMKNLSYSDPRNFYRQRNIHCSYCTGAYDQKNFDIRLNIHRSWFFLPWHRMMLYFHERILGNLIGDDTFALPFWVWDIPDGMMIPQIYMNETSTLFDNDRDHSHFPPCIVDLEFSSTGPRVNTTPEDQIKQNLVTMHRQMILGAKTLELFMGCSYKAGSNCSNSGTLENNPHNNVHDWTGSNLYPQREDMGVLYAAARDPIFYANHGNVDRLWEVWRELHEDKIISDPDWLDSYFFFHDEKKQLVKIKVRDVVNIGKLRYYYEKVDIPWLRTRPKPSIPPKDAKDKLMKWKAQNLLKLPSSFSPYGRSLDSTIKIEVIRRQIHRTKKEKEEEEEVLLVYGIVVKEDIYTKFDVYVNVVNETINNPSCSEFAGSFVYIPHGMRPQGSSGTDLLSIKHHLQLGISELLEDLEAEGDESILVTLVPRSPSNAIIDGVRIEYVNDSNTSF